MMYLSGTWAAAPEGSGGAVKGPGTTIGRGSAAIACRGAVEADHGLPARRAHPSEGASVSSTSTGIASGERGVLGERHQATLVRRDDR